MVVLSKLYSERLQNLCCNEIIHSRGCTDNLIHQIPKYIISNMKYFAVLTLLPLLLKINKLNRKLVKDTLTYYANTVFSGFQLAFFIDILICAFRRRPELFGRYNLMFLPVFISGFSIHWAAPKVQQLFGASIFQVAIDSLCLRRENVVARAIANSKGLRTFIFMMCSAIILHAKQQKLCKTFWFVTPNEQFIKDSPLEIENSEQPISLCHHKTSCNVHVLRGLRNYLTIGLSLDTIKMVMSKIPKDVGHNTFLSKLWAKLKNYQFNTTALLAASVGIYRLVNCRLNSLNPARKYLTINHLVASFLCGSAYIFLPKLSLLSYGLVICFEIFWEQFKKRNYKELPKNIAENNIVKFINSSTLGLMLFPPAVAYLVHTYVYRRHFVSALGEEIINGLTHGYGKQISVNIQRVERLMEAAIK